MNPHELPFEYISIQRITTALGEDGRLMSLMDMCGFFLCQTGTADVGLDDKVFHIQPGDVYFYSPSTYVSIINRSADLGGIAVKCKLEFVLPLLERLVDGTELLHLREHPCVSLSTEQQISLERMTSFLHERQKRLTHKTENSRSHALLQQLVLSLAESVFHELLYDYASREHVELEAPNAKDRIFQTFLVSLFRHYKQEREVAFYAGEQCLSPRYFSSIVKEKSGHPALQWIVQMVISSVCQTLKNTDRSIKEIASEYSFPSQSFFGKYFKQYVGMSPREYRSQARKDG